MILVTGATGKVGGHVVRQLAARKVPVRALVRSTEVSFPPGVEVVRGDLREPSSVAAALDGVTAVFLVWPFSDTTAVSLDLLASRAPRVVFLSAEAAAPGTFGQVRDYRAGGVEPGGAGPDDRCGAGRSLRWEELPPAELRPALVQAFGDEGFADGALGTWAGFVDRPEVVTTTVADVTGVPALPFARWVRDDLALFS